MADCEEPLLPKARAPRLPAKITLLAKMKELAFYYLPEPCDFRSLLAVLIVMDCLMILYIGAIVLYDTNLHVPLCRPNPFQFPFLLLALSSFFLGFKLLGYCCYRNSEWMVLWQTVAFCVYQSLIGFIELV